MRYIFIAIALLIASPAQAAYDYKCDGVKVHYDKRFDGGAAAERRHMIFNPRIMRKETQNVQKFIFYHECAHAQGLAYGNRSVKSDEYKADRIALERAVSEGWMTPTMIDEVCTSFGTDRESSSHPSAKNRCAALRKNYVELSQ